MLERLPTEQFHPDSTHLDTLQTADIVTLINHADAAIAAAVALEIPRITAAVEAIVKALSAGGHLIYIGAGTSGRLGVLDASEIPPTFGASRDLVSGIIAGGNRALAESVEGAEDDPSAGARDLVASGFGSTDVLVGIAASGRTPYVLGAITKAREMDAVTCGISCVPDSELTRAVDYPVAPVTGPEILTGSTRMRAGTATKMVLNMISTAVMIRLGHVYGNLMVNVAPSNHKLEDRARRVIQQATGVTYEEAARLLDEAGRNVRTAIVMQKRKVGKLEAEKLLADVGGRVRQVLEKH